MKGDEIYDYNDRYKDLKYQSIRGSKKECTGK
jgi:hypothetical protein